MGYFFLLLNLIPHIFFFFLPNPLLPTFSLFPLLTPTPTIYTPFKSKVVFFLVSLLLSLLVLFCLHHIWFLFLIFPISPAPFFSLFLPAHLFFHMWAQIFIPSPPQPHVCCANWCACVSWLLSICSEFTMTSVQSLPLSFSPTDLRFPTRTAVFHSNTETCHHSLLLVIPSVCQSSIPSTLIPVCGFLFYFFSFLISLPSNEKYLFISFQIFLFLSCFSYSFSSLFLSYLLILFHSAHHFSHPYSFILFIFVLFLLSPFNNLFFPWDCLAFIYSFQYLTFSFTSHLFLSSPFLCTVSFSFFASLIPYFLLLYIPNFVVLPSSVFFTILFLLALLHFFWPFLSLTFSSSLLFLSLYFFLLSFIFFFTFVISVFLSSYFFLLNFPPFILFTQESFLCKFLSCFF